MRAAPPATRFDLAFSAHTAAGLPGLIPYFTAGFPHLDDTPVLLLAAQRAGCIAAEIGIPFSDPLAHIDGLLNAIAIQTDTPQKVMVIGPGAGRFQAGQGMLADLIAIAKSS